LGGGDPDGCLAFLDSVSCQAVARTRIEWPGLDTMITTDLPYERYRRGCPDEWPHSESGPGRGLLDVGAGAHSASPEVAKVREKVTSSEVGEVSGLV
jgi:hypothetical protein